MTFMELARARYSVRSFQSCPVEEEKLNQILEAGRIAPTARNFQPQRIFVARSEEARQKLASVCSCTFGAPVILVVAYDRTRDSKSALRPGYEFGEMDASIVCTHMMLQATELGLGSCWVGHFNSDQVCEALGLPEEVTVAALLPLGYAAQDSRPSANHTAYRAFAETITEL